MPPRGCPLQIGQKPMILPRERKGHVRKRGSRWYYIVDVGPDPESGRRRQRRYKCRTKLEAERVQAELRGQRKAEIDQLIRSAGLLGAGEDRDIPLGLSQPVRGARGGRPSVSASEDFARGFAAVLPRLLAGEISTRNAAGEMGISPRTLKRRLDGATSQ